MGCKVQEKVALPDVIQVLDMWRNGMTRIDYNNLYSLSTGLLDNLPPVGRYTDNDQGSRRKVSQESFIENTATSCSYEGNVNFAEHVINIIGEYSFDLSGLIQLLDDFLSWRGRRLRKFNLAGEEDG